MVFADRTDAGKKLAEKLKIYAGQPDVALFALPRGGVVVGKEIADELGLPLQLIVTRKIGSPGNPEYAIGALAETGEVIWNEDERAVIESGAVKKIVKNEIQEAERRIKTYRKGKKLADLKGKTVILIDDGVATGLTMRAAVQTARHQHATKVVVAVPHGAKDSLDVLREEADEVITLYEPSIYGAVGEFYRSFPQVEDAEVLTMMKAYETKK